MRYCLYSRVVAANSLLNKTISDQFSPSAYDYETDDIPYILQKKFVKIVKLFWRKVAYCT